MKVHIRRKSDNGKQATGELSFPGFKCKTLELPWKGNKKSISCIPPGKYEVVKRTSPKYGEHFHVLSVPGRSYILIHFGNYRSDTEGCILVGQNLTDINGDGLADVTSSKATMQRMNDLLPRAFNLVISNETL